MDLAARSDPWSSVQNDPPLDEGLRGGSDGYQIWKYLFSRGGILWSGPTERGSCNLALRLIGSKNTGSAQI